MKNQLQKYLADDRWVSLFAGCVAAAALFVIPACQSPPPAKPPMLFFSEDSTLFLPAGNVISLPDGRIVTTKVDFLMLSQAAVSNLQAHGYLP